MNIFKEMVLSVYSFKSYKEFLKNRKSKVFLFGLVVMILYFFLTMVVPFLMNGLGLASLFRENIPDFELKNGTLWVADAIELDDGNTCVWIDTDPEEYFYDASELAPYYSNYTTVILMDSEKVIMKSNTQAMQQYYFDEMDIEFTKDDLMDLVPSIYLIIAIVMAIIFLVMTALFFFGVLFVALMGMIVASCMKYQLTFGQLYLLGVYSRVLPLIIKAAVSYLPFNIPFFWVINFGISVFILVKVIQHLKEDVIRQPLEFSSSSDDTTWK